MPYDRELAYVMRMLGQADQRLDAVVQEVGGLKGDVKDVGHKVGRALSGIEQLAQAMSAVVRLEVKHDATAQSIEQVSGRLDAHMARSDLLHTDTTKRIADIEKDMPQLKETRTWVTRAIAVVVVAVMMAVMGMVIVERRAENPVALSK